MRAENRGRITAAFMSLAAACMNGAQSMYELTKEHTKYNNGAFVPKCKKLRKLDYKHAHKERIARRKKNKQHKTHR